MRVRLLVGKIIIQGFLFLINVTAISYLAIKSALMCEADYLFIREWPQKLNWPEILCEHVLMVRKLT